MNFAAIAGLAGVRCQANSVFDISCEEKYTNIDGRLANVTMIN